MRDREEERAKARVAAEAVLRLRAGEEGGLDEIGARRLVDLVVEEARDGLVVPVEEHGACLLVAVAPGQVERALVVHGTRA